MPETIVSTAPVEVLFPLPTWGTPLERILLRLEDGGRPARTPGVVGLRFGGPGVEAGRRLCG